MMSPEGDDALNAKFRLGTHPSEKNRGFPTAWLLQESHPIATQLAKIAAFTQDYAAASVFRGITGYRFPQHYRPPFSVAFPAAVFRASRLRRNPVFVARHYLMK
ncbi:hypothetical protein FLT15_08960 [Paenibacillus thiaminolyticus]|uniref:hypothetical protein n=1 Tax=Paenibacillus thiaminolyticus TaxID=49283 RepID=UPI0011653433|nr:hypothetical protein [Paenibacillus thiaminolyticus]NGP58518.1 hypothetical protein [Paenibacillus thiaminolyticus]